MTADQLSLRVSKTQYQALKDLIYVDEGPDRMIEEATPEGAGFVLSGSWNDFDQLADCVAAEANHAESQRKEALYDRIFEKIEEILGLGGIQLPPDFRLNR